MIDTPKDVPLDGTEPTLFTGYTPFRKDGSPVLGSFGKTVKPVVLMTVETWNRLCEEHPTLKTARFRVGEI